MINHNTYLIQPNVSVGVRHDCRDLAVALIAPFGRILHGMESKRTLTP
jgi:hypothetical protein